MTTTSIERANRQIREVEQRLDHLATRLASITSKLADTQEELRRANNANVGVIETNTKNGRVLLHLVKDLRHRVRHLEDLEADSIYGHPHGDTDP